MIPFVRALCCIGFVVSAIGCTQPDANYEVLVSKNVQCPSGSSLRYLPWGESGLQAVCIMEHGPVVIAEYGRIQIEGQNEMGKQAGEWRWLDAAGQVTRTELYNSTKP
jgi:hypothetical protein